MLTFSEAARLCDQVSAALTDITSHLHLNIETLAANEITLECSTSGDMPADEVNAALEPELLEEWFSILGSSLRISFTVEEVDFGPVWVTSADPVVSEHIRTFVSTHDISTVEVELSLKKELLRQRLSSLCGVSLSAVFLFESALCKRLTLQGAQALSASAVLSSDHHATIGIVTAFGVLQGPLLTIVGFSGATNEDSLAIVEDPTVKEMWEKSLTLRKVISIWTAPVSDLAPDCFYVNECRAGLSEVAASLAALAGQISLLQFCEVVSLDDDDLVAQVTKRSGPEIRIGFNGSAGITNDFRGAWLYSLYRWALPSESRSRIDVVRQVIQEVLRQTKDVSPLVLEARGRELLEAAQATYAIICHDAFESYLTLRESAERQIQTQIDIIRQSMVELTENLLNTFLQFLAGALAVAITNSFTPRISPSLRTAGLVLALVYLFMIAVFRIVRTAMQHRTQLAQTHAMIGRYSELPDLLRMSFGSSLDQTVREFRLWFWLCVVAYALTALALIVILAIQLHP